MTQWHIKLRLVYLVWFQGIHKIFVVYESPLLSVEDVKHRIQLCLIGWEPWHTHKPIKWAEKDMTTMASKEMKITNMHNFLFVCRSLQSR